MIDANQAAGEYVFEVRADARVLQFRTNQQQVAENWVKWVAACSSEKRYQDTLRQLMTIDEGDEDAESILQDPAALEKKISVEIVKMILSSYYDIIRNGLDYIHTYLDGNFKTLTIEDIKEGLARLKEFIGELK